VWALLGLLALVVVLGLVLSLGWWAKTYAVDRDGVYLRTGILNKQLRIARLPRIQSVDIVHPLLGRILGLGRLTVEVAGSGDSRVVIGYLPTARLEELRERILALLDTASGEPIGESASRAAETPDPERRGQGRTPPADGRPDSQRRGHSAAPGLHARSLTVGWPDGPVVAGPFDIDVPRGGTLAVVGPSGIGKTTLLYTLAGLIRPRSGHVRLDGREVCDIPREEVSSTLVLTAEDAHVFATTVLENLRVARPDVTEEEAVELLDRAGLGGWLGDLPEGVHTLLGADATTMSGGERRRLLFARALASPADYLLLDEPAEHLDSDTADALVADLLAAGKAPRERERTVVLVTHRLTPLWQADRVILLSEEDGRVRVAAAGKHEELANLIPDYRWSLRQEL